MSKYATLPKQTIEVKVNPNSAKEEVIFVSENQLVVKFRVAREKNRANLKLIELLADYFGTSKSQIRIVAGHRAVRKLVEVCE